MDAPEANTPFGMNRRLFLAAVGAILLLAAALRVAHAQGRDSISRDEFFQLTTAQQESAAEVCRRVSRDGQTPLSYLHDWAIVQLFGTDFLLSRWPAGLTGWLTVLLLIELSRRWFGPRCALLVGLFAATSPYLVHYSIELRPYSLFGLLTVVFAGVYVRFREQRTVGWAVAWGVTGAVAVYCQYYALYLVLGSGLFALTDRPLRRSLLHALIGGAAFLLLFAPWLESFFNLAEGGGKQAWEKSDRPFHIIFWPIRLAVESPVKPLLWTSLLLGAYQFVRRRWPDRGRSAFGSLVVLAFGSALIAWITQRLSAGRGTGPRHFIGFTLLALAPACLYWSRAEAMGAVIVWRGLRTGRIYRMSPRVQGTIGLVLLVAAIALQARDRREWRRGGITAHPQVVRTIRDRGRPGDIIVVPHRRFGRTFGYHYEGELAVFVTPRHAPEVEAAYRRGLAEILVEIERCLKSGSGVWYYYPNSVGLSPTAAEAAANRLEPRALLWEGHLKILEALERDGERVSFWEPKKRLTSGGRLQEFRSRRGEPATRSDDDEDAAENR